MTPTLAINGFFIDLFFGGEHAADYGSADSDPLYLFIWWLSVFFFVLVVGLMIVFAIQYRRRPGVPAPRSPHHNTALEITWTIIPTFLLAIIFFWGYQGYLETQIPPAEAELVDLTGIKWNWAMTYSNGKTSADTKEIGNIDAPVFYMPAGRPVLLKMKSDDVLHSFWVPDFRTKLDVVPNRYTPYWFKANELDPNDPEVQQVDIPNLGTVDYRDHVVYCAEYCGDSHSEMAAVIRVVEPNVFDQWKRLPNWTEDTPLAERGRILYTSKGCNACHSVDGSPNTGPTWFEAYGNPVNFADGSSLNLADPLEWDNYLRESILDPGSRIHEGYTNQMPSYQGRMTDEEISYLRAYFRQLAGIDDGGFDAPAEAPADPGEGGEG